MSGYVTPNQSQIQTVLVSFLASLLPSGMPIVEGQDNRVAEPQASDFIVFWPLSRTRLATNSDQYADAVFIGSISGTTMTITTAEYGTLYVGSNIFGVNVATGTIITAFGTGTGGVGTYTVSPSQTVSSELLAAGVGTYTQETELAIQLDVHGPNSSDYAQLISTMFRDDYAFQYFTNLNSAISPLHADDPKQMPFLNAEQQYETRYVVNALIQANQTVTLPQQFATAVTVTLVNVEAFPL